MKKLSRMNTLQDWLQHLETAYTGGTAHSNGSIDMGLERVAAVRTRMGLQPACPLIMVAGTNGKGSVCSFLARIYTEAGFKTGLLTSPHLLHYNERIRINTRPVADAEIVAAFERIEAARGATGLTYFEFNTLAAVDIFCRAEVDVMILEVGLGGRLDAVNIFDADVAVVTSVDLDHQAFLGDTVEQVAFEKAGIFRSGKPALCAQNPPPESLRRHADSIGADLLLADRDYAFAKLEQQQWSFRWHPVHSRLFSGSRNRNALPIPALRGAYQLGNAACALAVLECLHERLPVDIGAVKRGLLTVSNPGRFQVLPGRPLTVLDVGHNPHAARAMRQSLMALPYAEKRLAVFSMLADKDLAAVVALLKDQFDEWLVAPLDMPRGLDGATLQQRLAAAGVENIRCFGNVAEAYRAALSEAGENDRITIFGSFHTVAEVMALLPPQE